MPLFLQIYFLIKIYKPLKFAKLEPHLHGTKQGLFQRISVLKLPFLLGYKSYRLINDHLITMA